MNAKIIDLQQGTDAWRQHRRAHFNASDAGVVLGLSPYKTRGQLLHEKATGLTPDIDTETQRRFDRGHEYEAVARPWAEELADTELFPVVLAAEIDGLPLSASLDGMAIDRSLTFEHKTGRADLLASLAQGVIPKEYWPQMEQGLLLSGAQRCLFMASSGDREAMRFAFYESRPDVRAKLIAAWKQFAEDVPTYTPPEVVAKPIGKAPDQLPALRVEISGAVTASNLPEFKARALAVFGAINRDLHTDDDFASAEKTVKWCGEVEDRLAAAKQHALSQTASIDELFRTIDDISAEARRVRLELDKLVKARKEQVRVEIVTDGQAALVKHIAALNERLGKPYMPTVPADFGGAIRGKKTVASIREAVNVVLTNAKLQANEIADRIQVNIAALCEHDSGHKFLFPDTAAIVQKSPDDLLALVKSRISDHQAAEARRLEAERERMRQEEQQRAQREIEQRQAAERAAAAAAATPAPAPAPAPAPTLAHSAPVEPTVPAHLMKLGELAAAVGLPLTADVLANLGFLPASTERGAKLYRAAEFPLICSALVARINAAAAAFNKAA